MPTKNLGFYDFLDFPLSQVQIQQKFYSSPFLNLTFENFFLRKFTIIFASKIKFCPKKTKILLYFIFL